MADLTTIAAHLDDILRIDEIPDYPGALNGLQLAGGREVGKVAAAVDASLPVVREAVEAGADLLVVHHGLFWSGAQPIVGGHYDKLKAAVGAGLAIYSCHVPLDVHPELGNNALLAGELGLADAQPFFEWKGIQLGLRAVWDGSLDDLAGRVERAVGARVHVCRGGGDEARTVGLITGGAGGEIGAVAAAGIDTFVTGEGPHWSFTAAEDLGVNIIYGGHYATETFGVRALAAHLAEEFGVAHEFIDRPTGL